MANIADTDGVAAVLRSTTVDAFLQARSSHASKAVRGHSPRDYLGDLTRTLRIAC